MSNKQARDVVRWARRFGLESELITWIDMNARCYDKDHPEYKNEGAKGVTVCPRWRWDNPDGFKNLILEIGWPTCAKNGSQT